MQTDFFPQAPTSPGKANKSPTLSWTSSPPAPEPSTVGETSSQKSGSSSQSTNKENAPPPPKEPAATRSSQIKILLESISSTLNTHFSKHPPHTVQRLAELILTPKQHYKTLPSYLHAVDRVVHVTSGANTFPLPPAIPDPSSSAILSNGGSIDPLSVSWGNPATGPQQNGLGSDESLGGALLTPISWLQPSKINGSHSPLEGEVTTESTEMIDGPNGMGGIETVSVSVNGISSTRSDDVLLRSEGGVTQGELLRQEQRAGVVPVAQLQPKGDVEGLGEEDESPHARGPDEIGPEDIGTQHTGNGSDKGGLAVKMQGIDVEAAVGRKTEPGPNTEDSVISPPGTPKREAEEEIASDAKRVKEDVKDAGGDGVVVDTAAEASVAQDNKPGSCKMRIFQIPKLTFARR